MSTQNNNAAATATQTGLLAKIMKALKLDEAGKVETFLSKEKKICEKNIKGLGQEKAAFEFEYNNSKDEINEKIEDAKEALEDAYAAITLKDIETNEKQAEFRVKFWNNIERKTNYLRALEEELKDLTKSYEEALKENKEQVEKNQQRIAKLS